MLPGLKSWETEKEALTAQITKLRDAEDRYIQYKALCDSMVANNTLPDGTVWYDVLCVYSSYLENIRNQLSEAMRRLTIMTINETALIRRLELLLYSIVLYCVG